MPLSVLEIDGTPPAIGDEAEAMVKVRIVSTDEAAGTAQVEIVAVNGQDVSSPAREPGEADIARLAAAADAKL